MTPRDVEAPLARPLAERLIFPVTVALMLVGVLAVYSSSAAVSLDRHGTPHWFLVRHLGHLTLASLALVALWRLDYRHLDRSSVVHLLWATAMVMLTLTLFQDEVNGARRWIRVAGVSIQPAELAKLSVVLLSAFQLSRRSDRLGDPWRGVLPPMLLVAQLAILVALQPDFGSAAMLLGLLGLLAFVAGTPLRLMVGFGVAASGLLALYLVQQPYRLLRLRSFLEPSFDPLGAGFQLRQSFIAVGTGGLTGRSTEGLLGTGFGCSLQKLFFLPEPHTDFVFAVLGEELGLVGTLTVLGLFTVLMVAGFVVAARAGDAFGTLLASGATAMVGIQALVNVMVVVGLLPTKGIPLPFLSAGGSSLFVSAAAVGLVLSVARHGC